LKNQAASHNLNITKMDIIAQTGWTSHDLLLNVTNTSFNGTYDFVIILIGANDQFQGVSPEIYKSNLTELLIFASTLTHSVQNVIVISIPDYSVSPLICGRAKTVVREEINALNFRISQASSLVGTFYLDITDIVRMNADDLSMLADDQLHFSGKMYNLWVHEIFSLLQVIIGESTIVN
jgi:lysophospholipase L1-like esterase